MRSYFFFIYFGLVWCFSNISKAIAPRMIGLQEAQDLRGKHNKHSHTTNHLGIA